MSKKKLDSMTKIVVRIPRSEKKLLRALAKATGKTMTQVTVEALERSVGWRASARV